MEGVLRISEMAGQLGVAPHTLRHWEDVGVLTPARSASGHRVYTAEEIARAQLILICQRAGLSLANIKQLTDLTAPDKANLVATHRTRIQRDLQLLTLTDRFLGHVLECRHPLITQCPDCEAFASIGARN